MQSIEASSASCLLLGLSLLGMLIPSASAAGGRAYAYNYCSTDIYCAVVEGCPIENPACDKAIFTTLPLGEGIKVDYEEFKVNTPIAIMCSHQRPNASGEITGTVEVSQLEINWRPDQSKTWFDISNVKGKPFKNEGETLYINEGKTAELHTCAGGTCKPGSDSCFTFYDEDNHDRRGMRACSPEVDMTWHICRYDPRMPEYGPLDATVKNAGYLNETMEV